MWSRITGGNSSTREERVDFGRQAPGDGEVRSFWTDKPPSVEPRSYWPDGSGGGFVSAVEWSTGNSKRNTIWTLDGDGQARRLACDPEIGTAVDGGTAGPDAAYFVVRSANFMYWQIMKVARTGP
jgi:hypothetical protein